MSPGILRSIFHIMIFSGILLVPAVVPHAVQDLQDLKTVIESAATKIGGPTNSSQDWGFLHQNPGPGGEIVPNPNLFTRSNLTNPQSTADLVQNITTTILRATYLLDTDKANWLNTSNSPTTFPLPPPIPTPPTIINITSLDNPYIDYISAVPNLVTALTALGRSWHKEWNHPVWEAIDVLQKGITTFSSSMLAADLIGSQAVLRTIRASSSLEDAQQAWSRYLNLPGNSKGASGGGGMAGTIVGPAKRSLQGAKRPQPPAGGHYTHKDLWGRADARGPDEQVRYGGGLEQEKQRHGGVARPFVA